METKTGHVRWYDASSGDGMLRIEGKRNDIYFHQENANFDFGDKVTFELIQDITFEQAQNLVGELC